MAANAELKGAKVNYAKTRPVFEAYKASRYSKKFLAEHEADIEIYRASRAKMSAILDGAKLPKIEKQKEEGRRLAAEKKGAIRRVPDGPERYAGSTQRQKQTLIICSA